MDKRTQRELTKIGASIPKSLMSRLIKTEKPEDNNKIVDVMMKSKLIDSKSKDRIKADYASGKFSEKSRQVVDKKVEREIDRYVEARVKALMKKGIIKKAERDNFIRKHSV